MPFYLQQRQCPSRELESANWRFLGPIPDVAHHAHPAWRTLPKIPGKFIKATQVVVRKLLEWKNFRELFNEGRGIVPGIAKMGISSGGGPNSCGDLAAQLIEESCIEKYSVDEE
jgi:hypothetical protein